MQIYLIETDKNYPFKKKLEPFGNVVLLDSGEKDIEKYSELFQDDKPKIIGINPAIIEWKFPIDVVKDIKNLVGISTRSSWAFYLDLDYFKRNNVVVANIAGANSQSVAEYAIWMMLCLARKLPIQSKRGKVFDQDSMQTEIAEKMAGIVGMGKIGSRVAKMCKGLGMKVVYWSPNSRNDEFKYVNLTDLLKNSDFVFNCIELRDETKGFFDKEKLSLLRSDSHFVSVMGGMGWGAEDSDFLIKLINENKLAGYAIEDEHEPKYKVPKIKEGCNIFIPKSYAYYTKEADLRSNNMWVESIAVIATKKYIRRIV